MYTDTHPLLSRPTSPEKPALRYTNKTTRFPPRQRKKETQREDEEKRGRVGEPGEKTFESKRS